MNIKQAKLRTGLSEDILRFYEKKGLIKPARNLINGYRDYKEEDILTIVLIRHLNNLGINLDTIKLILESGDFDLGIEKLEAYILKLEQEYKNISNKIYNARDLKNVFDDIKNGVEYRIIENKNLFFYENTSENFEDYKNIISSISSLRYVCRIKDIYKSPSYDIGILTQLKISGTKIKYYTYTNARVFRKYYEIKHASKISREELIQIIEEINSLGYKVKDTCFISQVMGTSSKNKDYDTLYIDFLLENRE